MKDLTFHDLCGQDHVIFARLEKDNEVTMEVWDEMEEVVYKEKSHIYAWDSLVSFAKMVLQQDEQIQKELEAK